jgi:hypothetical protein
MVLIACKLHLTDHYPKDFTSKRCKTASHPITLQLSNFQELMRVFLELDIQIDIMHPGTKQIIHVTRRADWGFGYGKRNST